MFSIISSLFLKSPFLKILSSRLLNRWTSSYAVLVVLGLVNLGVLPESVVSKVEGLPPSQLLIGCGICLVIFLLFHLPKRKTRIEKLQEEIDILKLEKELAKIKKSK